MTLTSKAIAAAALILLACIGALSFWSEVRNEKDREWVTHTHLVVEALQAIRIDITQAETGQRGYLLTGLDGYLAQYTNGVDKLRQDSKTLRDLTSDNAGQGEAIQRLEPLIAGRLSELSDGIQVRRQSGLMAGVEAVTHENSGELWMKLIATHVGEIRHNEALLLSARLDTAAASTRKTKAVIVWGNAVAILILFIKGLVIHREAGRRNQAEQGLKLANERLERRTAELSETNIELESFAYSVAHDLRAPLRHISGYSGVLLQDYGPSLGAEGLRCIGQITDGARKMGRLVDDLLGLSKIGRQELSLQDTSLDLVLAQALEDIAPECACRKLEWQIGKLFQVECDPGLMTQVFANLLSNAVKYTRKTELAVVQVGQTTLNEERVVFVRDNGAGFDMQYADKLFGVFQRLHKARDFEGTGVGLAIVQRIIRKHGGRIWAEAKLDQGATFFFTLGTPEINVMALTEMPIAREQVHVATS